MPVGISGWLASSAPSLGHMKQKKKTQGTHYLVSLWVYRSLTSPSSSSHTAEFSYVSLDVTSRVLS